VSARGGHAGFVAGQGITPVYWAEELILDFLSRRGSRDTISRR
jgi:predicted alpha/beta-fold hydrolase